MATQIHIPSALREGTSAAWESSWKEEGVRRRLRERQTLSWGCLRLTGKIRCVMTGSVTATVGPRVWGRAEAELVGHIQQTEVFGWGRVLRSLAALVLTELTEPACWVPSSWSSAWVCGGCLANTFNAPLASAHLCPPSLF